MSVTWVPHHYRLTRPDGLGFFRRRSLAQFLVACGGAAAVLVGGVDGALARAARVVIGIVGLLVVTIGAGRSPSGEDLVELLRPLSALAWRRLRRRRDWSAALAPWGGPATPPLLGGIALLECDPDQLGRTGSPVGVVFDAADGSVSALLRVHGDGFLLAAQPEREARLSVFGATLAALGREDGAVARVSWSQFCAPAPVGDHLAYMAETARDDPDAAIAAEYLALVTAEAGAAVRSETIVTVSVVLSRVRASGALGGDRFVSAIDRLLEECALVTAELARGGLQVTRPLPVAVVARIVRDRLDPTAMSRLERVGRSAAGCGGLVTTDNAFPLATEERRGSVRCDESVHRVLRVAEWPRTAVGADWLAGFLCERDVTRSFTVVFEPQARRVARRQALAVATRVGASIEDRERKGRRVGAEERRAQEAAEALDAELEAGAAMELLVGLVDVTAESEDALATATERVVQSAADCGMELRPLRLRQAEALVASLPLGRTVAGRAR